MNYNSGRLLLFPKVNEAKLNEQKAQKAYRLKYQIESDMKRNKTASLYNLSDKNKSQLPFDPKIKLPLPLFKNNKSNLFGNRLFQIPDHQKIWKLINRNLSLRHYQQERKSLHKAEMASSQEQNQINQSNLLYRRSIDIVRCKHKFKRLRTEQKAQQYFNPEKRPTKKFKQFFNIMSINKNTDQIKSLSPKLQNMAEIRSRLKKQNRKNPFFKVNNQKEKRKEQQKLMSLNGWKIEQDQLILLD